MDDAAEALLGLRDCDSVNDVPEENLSDNIARVSPLLDAVSKDMAFEVNTDLTVKKKRRRIKKKVNDVNEIYSMHQMEVNTGNTEEIMAPTNGILGAIDSLTKNSVPNLEIAEQPRLDVLPKENGSEVNASTTKKQKRNKKFMGSSEDLAEVKVLMNGKSGASDDTSDYHVVTGEPEDSLPHKDVPQLDIAEQPRLDVVPEERGSEGNTDTTKKKKVAVIGEVQCIYKMEKNMVSDNVGASDNASDYNVIISNEPEKDLPDKDVPLKLSEQLEMDVVPIEIAPECSAGKTEKRRRKKKHTAINEMQCMDEMVKNLPSNNDAPMLEPCEQTKIDHVSKENTSGMDPTKKRKRKKKVTVNEAQCMDDTGTTMGSTEYHMEIKSQVNDNLGASDYSSGYHVVSNEAQCMDEMVKNLPSNNDAPMLEPCEQTKIDHVSKENTSGMDPTKKRKRKKKVTVNEAQCVDETGTSMGSTENHLEIKSQVNDNLGASDYSSGYHVVSNEPERVFPGKDIPMLELPEQRKLDVSKENVSDMDTTKQKIPVTEHSNMGPASTGNHSEIADTKKKRNQKRKKTDVMNEVPIMDQGITEHVAEMKDGMDHTEVNIESERNLINGTVRPLSEHTKLDAVSIESALEGNTETRKRKRNKRKKEKDVNELQSMTQSEMNAGTSENADTKKNRKRKRKKADVMNEAPTMDQGITEHIAEMKDVMDHSVVNSESERNLINGTVRPLSEHTKLDAASIESALKGNTETRRRRRNIRKKVKDVNEIQSMTQLEMNAGTSENLAAFDNQIEEHVEPADKVRKWVSRNTERSVAKMKNKLKKMNPSDAMYKILLSDEEPVDAMFKILLPDPPIGLVHSVPCERQQQHHLYQVTEENDELENGINEVKNDKCLPEGLGKLQKCLLVNPIKRKLIVLDVNGLLADVVMPAPKDRRGDVHILRRAIFKRPFCEDFLNFCFQNFDVGIWSSRSKVIIDRIVDYLLGSLKEKLLFCWNMSHATETGTKTLDNVHKPLVCKELRKIWENFEGYDESNTLLLDDSPYKALLNPLHTAIFPSSFHYGDRKDNSLGPGGDLRVYLEGLLSSDSVPSYVEQNPFGQGAINEADPSWEFYSTVLQTVTSRSQSSHKT